MKKLFREVIKFGDSGLDVRFLIISLKLRGFNKDVLSESDNTFGNNAKEAVLRFQKRNGLEQTGQWGMVEHIAFSIATGVDLMAIPAADEFVAILAALSGAAAAEVKTDVPLAAVSAEPETPPAVLAASASEEAIHAS